MMKKNNKDLVLLGVNGWETQGHDASACLLVNNKIVSFVEEERFIRKRYAYDTFPVNAIKYCLETNNILPQEIDFLAFGWNMPKLYKLNNLKFPYTKRKLISLLFPKKLYPFLSFKELPEILYFDHHTAHASSAYRTSGFKNASILVLDGQGEDSSGWLGVSKNGEIINLEKIPISYSIGYFMEAACVFLGFKTSDAGKLMGLAAYGRPIYNFPEFQLVNNGYKVKGVKNILKKGRDQQAEVANFWLNKFKTKFPKHKIERKVKFDQFKKKVKDELIISNFEKNFAASIQYTIEIIIFHLVEILIKKTGERKLAYAGGVALNCTTNGKLLKTGRVEDLFIQPAANDAGVSLGAALEVAYKKRGFKFKKMNTVYYGPNFSDYEIEHELKKFKVKYTKENNISATAAKAISQGKIVAWFQGKMEVGPRALGARSIIANPSLASISKTVNIIKSREQWRPLAPSILEKKINVFFEHAYKSTFMLLTQVVKDKYKSVIPAVVHVDGTTRFHSVSKNVNRKYYKLIEEFEKITGFPLIMNTSFNVGGEPIVMTPEQALKSFFTSSLDCMAIENFWIVKNGK